MGGDAQTVVQRTQCPVLTIILPAEETKGIFLARRDCELTMNSAIDRLLNLHVADAMSRQVVTVSANSSMAEAAKVLSQHEITSAPVVNELEQCVGILTTTDFARRIHSQDANDTLTTPAGEFTLARAESSGLFHIEHVEDHLVSEHMSCAPQTIGSEQILIDAARYMTGEHIHHLVVVDAHARPTGVISSLDVISALVKAIDE
jgi:CBS domain-containing membrane protein